jgi:hypothetical protein
MEVSEMENTVQIQKTVATWSAFYITVAKILAIGVDPKTIEHRVNANGSVRIRYRVGV